MYISMYVFSFIFTMIHYLEFATNGHIQKYVQKDQQM